MTRLADGLLAIAWAATVAIAWGGPGTRPPWALIAGLALAGVVAAVGLRLEAVTGGRLWTSPVWIAVGLALVMTGALLHARARAALGKAWSPLATPGGDLITGGPYARLRHPAYAGLVLMALGTVLVHASVPVAAGAAGLAGGLLVKGRVEDRRLAARFGVRWHRWAARVPPWWPRPLRRRDRQR